MFNDRDIAVIGIGAVAAVFCLLLPIPFPWKIGSGFCTFVIFIITALIRLGRDGLTLEEYVIRQIRYLIKPRLWTFHIRKFPKRPIWQDEYARKPEHDTTNFLDVNKLDRRFSQITLNLSWFRFSSFVSLMMIILGLFFINWLQTDGTVILGRDIFGLLP